MKDLAGPPRPDPRRAFGAVAAFVGLLWIVRAVESVAGLDLVTLGVFPRRADGLQGVLLAPLVHGSWSHLVANTLPLLVLGTALLYGYPRSARLVVPAVYLGTGLAVWLLGRAAWHVGASGLSYGLLLFVFTMGVLRWDPRAIALAMIVFFLHGSMIWGVLPYDPEVSFESHLAGAAIGAGLAFALRRRDPPPPRKRYDWEGEDEAGGDLISGRAPPGRGDLY